MTTPYLTTSAARTLAATLPGTAELLALDDASLAARVLLASINIDVAMNYQGQKFDPGQEHEFPRVPFGILLTPRVFPAPPQFYPFGQDPTQVWDWDATANGGQGAAVVPANVLIAVIYQAVWLGKPEYQERLEALKSGLYSQSTGTAQEVYADRSGSFSTANLSLWAEQIMSKYRLRSGRML